MNQKTSIRIIKHGERQSASSPNGALTQERNGLRRSAREVAGNVAAWVREFKEQPRTDPRKAFAKLFVEPSSSLKPLT